MSGLYGIVGIGRAPWEEPCSEDADTAADDRAALMALEDADAQRLPCDLSWSLADAVTWCAQ